MPDLSSLRGKAALVTGASRGIGGAIAEKLAEQGAAVFLLARSLDEIAVRAESIREAGGRAEAMRADVADADEMEAAIEACQREFGRVDILVNNAGMVDPIARMAELSPADFARVIDVNVNGVFNGIRAALPIMLAQGSGTILTIGSGAAQGPLEGWSHYCASKAAALMLTRAGHLEYGAQGVAFRSLSPGTVRTRMQEVIRASGVNPVSRLTPDDHIPPEWVGLAIAWLATPAGAQFDGAEMSLRDPEIRRTLGLAG